MILRVLKWNFFFPLNVRHLIEKVFHQNCRIFPRGATFPAYKGGSSQKHARKMESILSLETKKVILATFVLNTLTACDHIINWLLHSITTSSSTFQCSVSKVSISQLPSSFMRETHCPVRAVHTIRRSKDVCVGRWHCWHLHRYPHSLETALQSTRLAETGTTEKEGLPHINYAIQKADRNKGQ